MSVSEPPNLNKLIEMPQEPDIGRKKTGHRGGGGWGVQRWRTNSRQSLSSEPSRQSARWSHRYSAGMQAPLLQVNWLLVHVLPAGGRTEEKEHLLSVIFIFQALRRRPGRSDPHNNCSNVLAISKLKHTQSQVIKTVKHGPVESIWVNTRGSKLIISACCKLNV